MRRIAPLLLVVPFACDAADVDPPADAIPMLDPAALEPVDARDDPLVLHRPVEVDCPPGAWGPEGGGFEVQTGVCNYAAFDQDLPMPLVVGDTLRVTLWHDTLDAAEPATAHVAVWVGETILWEDEVDIPGPSGQLEALIPIEDAPPGDARIGLHLHNHGFNSWRWVSLDLLPAAD